MNIVVTGSIAFDYLMSFPGQVHRAPDARARAAGEPQLSRGLDGQAARRLRPEHRLHAGAARRAAAADGHGRAGLRRYRQWLEAAGVDTSLVQDVPGKFTASFFCSTDATTTRSRPSTPARWRTRASCRSGRSGPCDVAIVSPNDPGGDAAVRAGVPHAGHSLHLRSGPAVRAHERPGAAGRHRRRDDGDLQRLRAGADSAEDGLGEQEILQRGRRCWSSPAASTGARS